MDHLYLIAHKVRGELAFDTAIKLDVVTEEEVWIVPTSGHRAYPFWSIELTASRFFIGGSPLHLSELCPEMPEVLRDHYDTAPPERREAAVRKSQPLTPGLDDL